MDFVIEYTETAEAWLAVMLQKDRTTQKRIAARINRMAVGNFGDHKMFGSMGELRIDFGPGYRVYFAKRGQILIVVLCGGDKSTQPNDFKQAEAILKNLK